MGVWDQIHLNIKGEVIDYQNRPVLKHEVIDERELGKVSAFSEPLSGFNHIRRVSALTLSLWSFVMGG